MVSGKLYKNVFNSLPIKKIAEDLKTINNKETFIYEDDQSTVRSIFAPHWFDNTLKEFVNNNPMIDIVKDIIGTDVYTHQVHFNYKSANIGGEYAWHSDYTFWQAHDGMPSSNALSLLFLLDDMTEENGPLVVLPGSEDYLIEKKNKDWTIKHDANEKDGMITENMVSITGLKRHTVLGKAGDVFVMHANMWHTSGRNTSSKDRNVLFICYNSVDNKTTKTDRPDYITLRDFSPV
jgi:ectoine hydroxylase